MATKLEMLDIFQDLRRWFSQNNIDPKTVKVDFIFNTAKDAAIAEASYKQELTPSSFQYMNPQIDGANLMGIKFYFDYLERYWTEEEVEMARQLHRAKA